MVIKKISAPKKTYDFMKNLSKTQSLLNLTVEKNKIKEGYAFTKTNMKLPSKTLVCGYNVGGRYFVYTSDNYFYEIKDKTYTLIKTLQSRSDVITFTHKGEEKILIGDTSGHVFVLGKNGIEEMDLYPVEKMVLHAGRLFSSVGNQISFSTIYDFDDTELSFTLDGTIMIPEEYGSVCYMTGLDEKLYIFTTKDVFYLSCQGESIDFKIKRFENVSLDIEQGAIRKVMDKFIYVENGRLYQFYKGEIKELESLLDNGYYTVIGESASLNNKFLLPVSGKNGKKGVFVYDTFDKTQAVVECTNPIICDGGHVFDSSTNYMWNLLDSGSLTGKTKNWTFIEYDFNSTKNKIINNICVDAKSECQLYVKGMFGETSFKIFQGYNDYSTNLLSKYFEFEITTDRANFEVCDFKVEYREMEK